MNIFNTIIIAVVGIALIVVIYFVGSRYIKLNAINECIHAATLVSTREDGSKLSEPDKFWYDFCMDEKGLN